MHILHAVQWYFTLMDNSPARRLSVAARARYGFAEHGPGPLLALLGILVNGAAGAGVHYGALPFRTHLQISVVVAAIVTWASIQAIRRNFEAPVVRRVALLLLSLTFSELLLGVGSYMNLLVAGTLGWFPVAHAAMGVALAGSSLALTVAVYRRVHPEDAELAHGGVAIA